MEIYLIRHTSPDPGFSKGICYGQSDIPLAETFHSETVKLLNHFPESFAAVYSSPMGRCFTLAELIRSKQQVITDKRLLEMNFGDWETKKWDEIDQGLLNEWMKDFVNTSVPNGENFLGLNDRVSGFMNDLAKMNYEKVAIVTHAGVIRSVLCQVLEIPLRNAFKIPVDYGSISKITIDEKSCFQSIKYINKIV
jgi:alpha-ribazole phosphatase